MLVHCVSERCASVHPTQLAEPDPSIGRPSLASAPQLPLCVVQPHAAAGTFGAALAPALPFCSGTSPSRHSVLVLSVALPHRGVSLRHTILDLERRLYDLARRRRVMSEIGYGICRASAKAVASAMFRGSSDSVGHLPPRTQSKCSDRVAMLGVTVPQPVTSEYAEKHRIRRSQQSGMDSTDLPTRRLRLSHREDLTVRSEKVAATAAICGLRL